MAGAGPIMMGSGQGGPAVDLDRFLAITRLVRAHGGDPDRADWFHDLLHPDGSPYDPDEVAMIRAIAGPAAPRKRRNTGT